MSLFKTLNIGMTGMNATGAAMSIVSDNIANVNTTGFKASRARFQDLMASTTLGIGDGVKLGGAQQQFKQGSLEMTGNSLDLAIGGSGFMMVKGSVNGNTESFLTRNGSFMVDNEGFISTPGGLRLQGFAADANGNIASNTPGDLMVGDVTSPPKATSSIDLRVNLDASDEINTFDPANPGDTSNHTTSVTLYDNLGNAIDAGVHYVKTADNTWEYHVMVDGDDVAGGTPGEAQVIGTGSMSFDENGALTDATAADISFTPAGAGSAQSFSLSLEGTTQFASASSNEFIQQDGYAAGELRGLDIGDDGMINGVFSNGETLSLGQVAIADVDSPEGLEGIGGNMWRATAASGQALIGEAGVGGRGALISGAIEGSNVDLTHEFVKMIALQRGFQASSRTISTGDQMLTEVISLKR